MTAADRYLEWDAAYVLGSLAPDERREYETHLAGCAACRGAVAELSGLPGVLGLLETETALTIRDQPDRPRRPEAGRSADAVPLLAARVARTRRRRRWATGLGVAAALVIGATLGAMLPQALAPAARAETLRPVGGSGLSARLDVVPVGWGTRLTWSCDYRPSGATPAPSPGYGPVEYSLVVTTDEGATETVATWSSSGAEAKDLAAATHVPSTDIRSIDIRVTGSTTPLAEARL